MATQKTERRASPAAQPSLLDELEQLPDDIEQEARVEVIQPVSAAERPAIARHSAVASQILAIARTDPGKIEQFIGALQKASELLVQYAIKSTAPRDWTLYRDRAGNETAVLRDNGAARIRQWLGISIFSYRNKSELAGSKPEPLISYEDVDVVEDGRKVGTKRVTIAEMWADAICERTGLAVEAVYVGLRTDDGFVGRGHAQDLKASCRTSLDTKATRILSGLRKVDPEHLTGLGLDMSRAWRGGGYGSSQQRAAAGVAEEGVAEMQQALRERILRMTGGDEVAARDVLKDITKWKGRTGKERWASSIEELTETWKVEKANKNLDKHPLNEEREPGEEG